MYSIHWLRSGRYSRMKSHPRDASKVNTSNLSLVLQQTRTIPIPSSVYICKCKKGVSSVHSMVNELFIVLNIYFCIVI